MLQVILYITSSMFTIVTPIILLTLLKNEIECGVRNAYVILVVYFAAFFLSDIILPDSVIVYFFLNLFCIIIPAIIFKKNLANTYIFWFCIIAAENIFGNIMTVFVAIISGYLSNGRVDWLNMNEISVPAALIIFLCLIVSIILAYLICNKIKYIVLNLKGFIKYFLLIAGVGTWIMNSLLKPVVNINYNVFPTGILLFFDTVVFFTGSVALIICYTMHIRYSRAENCMIKLELEKEEEKYRKNIELQKQLKILNHEVRNYLNAGNPETKKNISDYCDTILKEQELLD